MPSFDVRVTAEYESGASTAFDAALSVIEALHTSAKPWPVTLKIEVSENA